MTSVYLVGEDELCLAILDRMVAEVRSLSVFDRRNTHGFGNLQRDAAKYRDTAKAGLPVIALTDLDRRVCASALVSQWLPSGGHPKFLLRVAVHEAETWVLADRRGFASHFGVKLTSVPTEPETCADAKGTLLSLVNGTRKARWRGMLPGGGHAVGPDYNRQLGMFIRSTWSPTAASVLCDSARRCFARICELGSASGPPLDGNAPV